MLVLSRKSREAVVVGTQSGADHLLKIIVLEISNGKVKLGFDVAAEVPVHRLEVWERICAERAVERSRAGPEASSFD